MKLFFVKMMTAFVCIILPITTYASDILCNQSCGAKYKAYCNGIIDEACRGKYEQTFKTCQMNCNACVEHCRTDYNACCSNVNEDAPCDTKCTDTFSNCRHQCAN